MDLTEPIGMQEVIGGFAGTLVGLGGVGLWTKDLTGPGWGLVILGGLCCGAIAAEDGNEGVEMSFKLVFLPLLVIGGAGAVIWAILQSEELVGVPIVLAGYLVVAVGIGPLLFIPFMLGSGAGGFVRGRLTGTAETEATAD